MRNYAEHALDLFAGFGDHEAIVAGDRRLTYTELRALVLNLAAGLYERGARDGTTVAVVLGHPLEGPAVLLALHLLGCRTVWVRTGVTRREVDEHLSATRPSLVLYDARSANPFGASVAERLGVPVVSLGPSHLGPDLLGRRGSAGDFVVGAEPEVVFQTSGTTGSPKLVHHRHGFYWQIHRLAEQIIAAGEPRWRHLTLSVLSHVSGQLAGLLYLFCGSVLVLMEEWEAGEFLATIEREKVNSTFIPPPDLYEILSHPALPTTDVSSMRMLSVGAAPASPARLREAIGWFGSALRITYGLSECPFISAHPALSESSPLSSCGQPYGDVVVQIRAEDGRTEVPLGEVGELWVRSDLNFAGYYANPALTAATLVDGWVRTHDLGYRDEAGYLYLVGRTQDLIISGRNCRKVFPRPIEDVLASHTAVRAAAVIGVPHPTLVEAIHAYVVPAPNTTITAAELITQVHTELTEFWTPRTLEFIDHLPTNPTGKIDKPALRRRWAKHRE